MQRHFQKSKITRCLLVLLAILCLGLMTGCGEDKAPSPKAKPKPKVAAKKNTEAPPQTNMEDLLENREETYQPRSSFDPFRPIAAVLEAGSAQDETQNQEALTPLQRMSLSQIRLVAILLDGANSRALVEDSTGTGYIIQVGTPLGTKGGTVTSILADKIKIEEYSKNYLGEKTVEESFLEIPKDPNEASLSIDSIEGEDK